MRMDKLSFFLLLAVVMISTACAAEETYRCEGVFFEDVAHSLQISQKNGSVTKLQYSSYTPDGQECSYEVERDKENEMLGRVNWKTSNGNTEISLIYIGEETVKGKGKEIVKIFVIDRGEYFQLEISDKERVGQLNNCGLRGVIAESVKIYKNNSECK